ncbi:hypothetical protein OAR16_00340 [bacterium]|nr:hypothetical protein [bacterium]
MAQREADMASGFDERLYAYPGVFWRITMPGLKLETLMSCNSPLPNKARRLHLQGACAAMLTLGLLGVARASITPLSSPASHPAAPGSVLAGDYLLRFFGWRVYAARL